MSSSHGNLRMNQLKYLLIIENKTLGVLGDCGHTSPEMSVESFNTVEEAFIRKVELEKYGDVVTVACSVKFHISVSK